MLRATLIEDDVKEVFRSVMDVPEVDVADVLIGLLDDETDKACGILGAQSAPDGDDGLALTICFVSVAETYANQDGERVLLSYLLDLAEAIGCSAVFCTGRFLDEGGKEKEDLLSDLGFFAEEETFPLYTFTLSDITVKTIKSDLACVALSTLTDEQWQGFVEETEGGEFFIMDREMYDKDLSVFLADDEKRISAGVLLSRGGDVLFVDALAAYGSDEEALINDLILWGADGAKKRLSPGMQVDIFMPKGNVYRDILMKVTGNKAKRIGNLMTFTFETPVFA